MKRFRLTPMQEAMLYETSQDPSRYVTVLRYNLQKGMDAQMFAGRLEVLTARHEALRTTFVRDDDGVFWSEITDRVDDKLFKLELRGNELTVVFHHALLDGWSVGILMRELLAQEEPCGKASPFRYYVKWLESRNNAEDFSWWKEYLNAGRVCSELPNFRKPDGYERRELRFAIEKSELLRNVARELRITAGKLIEAVWCMLIARYNGGKSVVCAVNAGRSAPVPGIAGIVGMCVNTLPILTKLPKLPESVSFADWVREWSRQSAEAEKHGFCGLGDIISGSITHILSIDPSFDGKEFKLKSSSARLVTDFDAAFTLGGEIKAEFAYNAHAYSDEAVKAIQGHFLTALNAILENPLLSVERIPILTDAEIAELTAPNENKEILGIIKGKTVADLWRESAEFHNNLEALVCGDVRLTYSKLSDMADKLSLALKARGVGAEMPAAILLSRSERYVITELAIMLAGGMFIPLDAEWPDDRIQAIIAETKPLIVIDEDTYAELVSAEIAPPPTTSPTPRDAAYMIMTSGTTGVPKGVVVEHRSLANYCLWAKERYGWKAGDASALELSFSFDGSFWSIWLPLISGGTLHILRDDTRFDLAALGNYCRLEYITHIDLPVTMANAFREIYRDEHTLPDLRVMVTGGEDVRLVRQAPYPLSNEYGPTECTVCCSVGWMTENDTPITVGTPPPNMNVYILDEWNRLCPEGVTGQASFSGTQIARGYYNAPDLTAARFILNPFADGDSAYKVMYRTGDIMKWVRKGEHRELIFVGRADSQVKINGFRVELGEIENILCGYVTASAVTAINHGTGEKRLVAYVVSKAGLDISELNELLASKLPTFMRPTIIPVHSIPLTSSGKVDFKRLSFSEREKTADSVAPATENEGILISAVSRILGVNNIGTNYNYIELGGNSINAMRVAFALEKEGFTLSAKELIRSASFADAAIKMRRLDYAAQSVSRYDPKTFVPFPAQQAFVFLVKTVSPAMYTVTLTLKADGLVPETLRKRLGKAAELHDILRASFEYAGDGRIMGRINNLHKIRVSTGNIEADGIIDPLCGPLLDLSLHNDQLTVRYHHIALDGWSVNLLVKELIHGTFPETAPSFAEFANRLAANDERRVADEIWWREKCHTAEALSLFLPKSNEKSEYKRIEFCPPELLAKCSDAARKVQVTPAAFALAAWGVVLNALYGEDSDLLIPFVASCRDDDNLMGMCAEARPLTFGMKGEGFGELARHTQEAMLESVSHWFVPQDIVGNLPRYLFVFDDAPDGYIAGGDQNYDLIAKISDKGELIYSAAALPDTNAQTIASHLNAALTAAANGRVSELREGEYELVTKTFAYGRRLSVKHKTAAEGFITAVKAHAGCVALETGTETLTYSELYARAKKLAGYLNALGIGTGSIAAFCLSRNTDGIIAQIGIALSGAAFLPLDPAWPEGRISEILCDSGAAVVISSGLNIELTGANSSVPDDSAYVIYTSGTTGRPKGVVIPQSALASQIAWAIDEFGFRTGDRMLHYIAFTFDPSVWVLFTAITAGAALSLLPESVRLDPAAVARYVEEQNITRCTLPAAIGADVLRRVKKSCLKTVFLGGEAIKNLPSDCRDYEIINCYGPTEACINAAFYRLPPLDTETSCIGHPVANTDLLVLNRHGEPCPIGIQGELYIGGVQLAHGYLNRAAESEAAFTEHPVFGRLYKTGDRAAWNGNGTLTFWGRRDSQVKIRGNRVELSEIEHALCGMPGISDAKVMLSDGTTHAYVVCGKNTPPPEVLFIKRKLSEKLPSYMLPGSVTVMNSFPLTENGKIDFNAFPVVSASACDKRAEPLSGIEKSIADAWKTALGLAPDFTVGRGDSFYDLGGHSLLLFHVVGLLAASGINADIRTLIEHPVLMDLGDAISKLKSKPSIKKAAGFVTSAASYEQYVQKMEAIDLTKTRTFRNVLVTGGTGFLGSHLVREFYINTGAVIHLPVRGDVDKIWDSLHYYFSEYAEDMAASGRIRAVLSDISEKPPDIDAPLDAIFHTAADIRHYAPEPEMYRANVTATEYMLTMADRNPDALFAHISTTSAVNAPIIFETTTDLGPAFDNIYQYTKQLAEQRVLDAGTRGLKYSVFRVGHVSPGFESGSVARNWEINAMLRLINSMLLTGLLPEQDYKIGYGYADKVARAIRLLSTPLNLENLIFHIDNPNSLRLSELFTLAGLRGQILPKCELISQLETLSVSADKRVGQAASEYLGRLAQSRMEKESTDIVQGELYMDATLSLLKQSGFEWPCVTAGYMQRIIRSLKEGGMD